MVDIADVHNDAVQKTTSVAELRELCSQMNAIQLAAVADLNGIEPLTVSGNIKSKSVLIKLILEGKFS